MAPGAEMAPRPPRMPKLTYRNRLPADQSSLSSLSETASTGDTISEQRPPTTPISPAAPSFDSGSTTSSTSLASSNGSTSRDSSKASKKKKPGAVLGFLTLREPSQIALEQFAESQRKQAASKGGSITSTGSIQGISPQKLPANVPKVNSKWDGVPESLKSPRSSRTSTSSKRTSSSSQEARPLPTYSYSTSMFSVATDGSRDPPNSIASAASSSTDITQRRDSGSSGNPPLNSPSTSSLPEITYFFPDNPNPTGALPRSHTQPTPATHPWSPPPLPSHTAPEPVRHPHTASNELAGPEADMYDQADAIFKRLNESPGRLFLVDEAKEARLEDEDEDLDLVPETHGFLFEKPGALAEPHAVGHPPGGYAPPVQTPSRKPPMNFSRPRHSPHAHKPAVSALPTLYEASIASTDTITDLSDLSKTATEDSDAASIAPSVAPSVTPSEMSASWYKSPRERLGLGGRIRKNDVLPWESQEEPPGKPKKGRLSVFHKN
ncbi:hypothetical protein BU26DRAFT_528361 [Trematosphaeria pertusa]|uniref:Uncharacterized protein n=1 Tax=Trematosphaeria pertusa TaxID=390896 RepID=A0A6A6IRN5_9PLEO|nr:uncharacterized protein BU26DRAFT_528361 [Trematosphaeria pertusa]KAF2253046.1 hypothetical protein BU26DRAFT_528361 [Trematosphaeria pertusa]